MAQLVLLRTPALIITIATAGEFLGWHPHLHLLVTDGGFLADGTFRHLLYFDSDNVEQLFRAEVLRLLLKKDLLAVWCAPDVLEFIARVTDHILLSAALRSSPRNI